MIAGTITNNNLALRCPFCGDSEMSPNKAHFSVNLSSGLYHCFRCQVSGRLNTSQLLELHHHGSMTTWKQPVNAHSTSYSSTMTHVQVGALEHARPSRLPRYHLVNDEGEWDAFLVRDPYDREPVGLQLRKEPKFTRLLGETGLAWPSDWSQPLCSTQECPLRLVEGPYDVVNANDVCVFGLISTSSLKLFAGHSVILCPDGDIWAKLDLRSNFLRLVERLLDYRIPGVHLVGIEMLPENLDPDEASPADRQFVPRSDLFRLLAIKSKRRYQT